LKLSSKDRLFTQDCEKELSNVTAFWYHDDPHSPCIFTGHTDGSINIWSNTYRLVKRVIVNLYPVTGITMLPENVMKQAKKIICFTSPFSIAFFSIDHSKMYEYLNFMTADHKVII
jgi:hypothetical protein